MPGPQAVTTTTSNNGNGNGAPIGGGGPSGTAEAHTPFETSQSTTYRGSTVPFDIQYGSGATEGYLATDVVSAGGLTVQKQVFAVVRSLLSSIFLSDQFGADQFDRHFFL